MAEFDQLPPWEQIPYFQLPVQTSFTLPNGNAVIIANADPYRTWIGFYQNGTGTNTPNITLINAVSGGLGVYQSAGGLSFNIIDHGNLVTQQWFGYSGPAAGAQLGVVTVSRLPTLPGGTVPSIIERQDAAAKAWLAQQDAIARNPKILSPNDWSKLAKVPGQPWAKPASLSPLDLAQIMKDCGFDAGTY